MNYEMKLGRIGRREFSGSAVQMRSSTLKSGVLGARSL